MRLTHFTSIWVHAPNASTPPYQQDLITRFMSRMAPALLRFVA